eukprot:CAMPEP_0184497304 /NCGR_PEP_ID=MMETSP0113_2-20130426/36137_1 /TAXON_ID=91329 /ORGANISM="Norrisiella sphaerica, Strain BC52" /LENGTH=368 /DNA_ID=CAMNT_0026884337 /DNA_START=330 /DNA_END=1436 /DNA_ORIENTATION=+
MALGGTQLRAGKLGIRAEPSRGGIAGRGLEGDFSRELAVKPPVMNNLKASSFSRSSDSSQRRATMVTVQADRAQGRIEQQPRIIDTELVRFARENLAVGTGGVFLKDSETLKDNVMLFSPLWRVQGKKRYMESMKAWRQNIEKLPEVRTTLTEVVEPIVGRGSVRIRWKTTWVPPDLVWFAKLRKKIPFNIEINITGVGEPKAVVYGVTFMEFQTNGTKPLLIKQTDQLEMEKIFSNERILERRFSQRLCEDLLEFLSTRRPLGWTPSDWAARIVAMLDLSSVGKGRLTANAATIDSDPQERAERRRREKFGVGAGLILIGIATLVGANLRKSLDLYNLEKNMLEDMLEISADSRIEPLERTEKEIDR